MGLAYRVIPTILCRGRAMVKGRRFAANRVVGVAAQAVRIHQTRGVDELILLDIGATPEGRGPDLDLVRELADVCFAPLTVGGGVRSVEDVRALLRAGADKVAICTTQFHTDTLRKASERFGSQAIVMAVDAQRSSFPSKYAHTVWSDCGKQQWPMGAASFGRLCAEDGAGEILLTSIDREGTSSGYDLELIRSVSGAVSIPVIAHGGCSGPEDMLAAIKAGASACAAGALFQFSDITPRECSRYLAEHGIEART